MLQDNILYVTRSTVILQRKDAKSFDDFQDLRELCTHTNINLGSKVSLDPPKNEDILNSTPFRPKIRKYIRPKKNKKLNLELRFLQIGNMIVN